MPAGKFKVGDSVHVWSNSQASWIEDGKVIEVAETVRQVDDRKVPAGSVLVTFDGGENEKWILFPKLAQQLRKVSPADELQEGSAPAVAAAQPASKTPAATASEQPPKPAAEKKPVAAVSEQPPKPEKEAAAAPPPVEAAAAGGCAAAAAASRPPPAPACGKETKPTDDARKCPVAGDGPERPKRMSSGTALCKYGCGKPVQPGLTKGMQPYDTCCKQCAVSRGTKGHSANCGGGRATRAKSKQSPVDDCKLWLEKVLRAESAEAAEALNAHTKRVFVRGVAARSGDEVPEPGSPQEEALLEKAHITLAEVQAMVSSQLLKQFDTSLSIEEAVLKKWIQTSGTSIPEPVQLNASEFTKLCKAVLEHMYKKWYPDPMPVHTHYFVRRNNRPLNDVYTMGKKLGRGSTGDVFEATHRISGEKRVCKKINKALGEGEIEEITQEIENMAMIDHPSVCQVYEYFEDDTHISQIMELCAGGELQHRIDAVFKRGSPHYGEDFIRDIMKQTLKAVAFMHGEHFMHKDLKPANIMLVAEDSATIKVIDFGISELFEPGKMCDNFGGTLVFMAPEMLDEGEFDKKVDIWSAGVILYQMITGSFPFAARWPYPGGAIRWEEETMRIILEEEMTEHAALSNGTVSAECIDLMRKMLQKKPADRLEAAECLEHPWFTRATGTSETLSIGVTQCLSGFASVSPLKKALFHLLAHESSVPAVEELRSIFMNFDRENKGTLSINRVFQVLLSSGMTPLHASIAATALDTNNNGHIEWTEFLAAALCVSNCRRKSLVDAAFCQFDTDQDGVITAADLVAVLGKDEHERWRDHIAHEWKKLAKGQATCSMDDFGKYLGKDIHIVHGDAVSACSMPA